MKILLDECLPRKLKRHFSTHRVTTVPEAGWAGIKNGRLLTLAAEKFDVFLTFDRSIQHQQNAAKYDLAIIVLIAKSNRLSDIEPLIPTLLDELPSVLNGTVTNIVLSEPSE